MKDNYGNDLTQDFENKMVIAKNTEIKNLKDICLLIESTVLWIDYEDFVIDEKILAEILKRYNNDLHN
jgi:hypothetical protein